VPSLAWGRHQQASRFSEQTGYAMRDVDPNTTSVREPYYTTLNSPSAPPNASIS
jgi:hypothetical protein